MQGETVFTQEELRSVWSCAKKKLLVYRKALRYAAERLPFGILAKKDDRRIFYGDIEYHSDTLWLRSTPYLIRLLRLLGEEATVSDILINTLDHQMTECAIFYNQELFSR